MTAAAPRCDRTPAWAELAEHHQAHGLHFDLRRAFKEGPDRARQFFFQAPGVAADLSKNWFDTTTVQLLLALAQQCELPSRRDAMFQGDPINTTENRAVLHTALRAPPGCSPWSPLVHEVLDAMLSYAESVRQGGRIKHVVNIGIGGSDLGPQMVVAALDAFTERAPQLHFVSNVDGHDLQRVLRHLSAKDTLFIVASKTFTTQETLANAHAAKSWFLAQGGTDISSHFVAVTTNVAAAQAFGIHCTFGFWDWVGGRYSLWSAVGLSIALAIGATHFKAMLSGAHAMDQHFASAAMPENLPVVLGLLDVWYRNFHGFTSRSVAPYHQGLARLPAYLQQLEMESNGKCVDLEGARLPFATSPVVWGEPGTNGQHAYFQMLHQGTDVIPVEFILVKKPSHPWVDSHTKLLANGLAQAQALMLGRSAAQALQDCAPTASGQMDPVVLAQHRSFPGNRPSTTLLVEELTPTTLGALLALYEHRVFVSGAVWGINSFDQWGVELGKSLCTALLPRLASGDTSDLDSSTANVLRWLRSP